MEKISVTKEQEELSKLIKHVSSNQKKIILQQDGQEVVILPVRESGFWNRLMAIFAKVIDDKFDVQKADKRVLGSLQNKGSSASKVPIFGCAKGKFKMSDDFDDELEDFKDYME